LIFQTFVGQIAWWMSITSRRHFVLHILLSRDKIMVIILRWQDANICADVKNKYIIC